MPAKKGSPKAAGSGRKKGVQNKVTRELKALILGALSDQPGGGQAYLSRQATKNPTAFMALLGKVLPMQVTGDANNPVRVKVEIEIVDPAG